MKESYREGVASHPGPQPCEGGRETALEAWEKCRIHNNQCMRHPIVLSFSPQFAIILRITRHIGSWAGRVKVP